MLRHVALSGVLTASLLAPARVASAQEIGRLYAPRPPAGSAYLRFVTNSMKPVRIGIEGAAVEQALAEGGQVATPYRIVKGGEPVRIAIDGQVAASLTPNPDQFTTVLVSATADGFVVPIVDATDGGNDLKADLRIYNLVKGCDATVSVAGGPAVFKNVGEHETRRRAVNAVEASLVGQCAQTVSASFKLPSLKAGDHYSLFLIGTSDAPILTGQLDTTEAYKQSE